ncbi:glycosyltransferase [Candidatus Gottesmanbacteria bacterium]|nr:glycosyltransferase [Candidatus Gottesmanbacteria bacterium]
MKVALVYDRINKWGGAERVLLALHEIWPEAPLFTAVYDPGRAQWADVFVVKSSFMQYIPFAKNHHEWFAWLTPMAFESFSFDEFDVVISVTSAEAKCVITKPHTLHICYCLTPTRYLWSGHDVYAKDSKMLRLLTPALRRWDRIGSSRPDYYIAISDRVKERIQTYYGKHAEAVIYPPVDIDQFDVRKQTKDFYLVVSRLVPYKRIDLIVDAFNTLQLPLVIIGSGTEERLLRAKASGTISFVSSHLTDAALAAYYGSCRAFLSAADEDFGIAAVEAQAAGKPVIAFAQSATAEIVQNGKTGIVFGNQSKQSIIDAVKKLQKIVIRPKDCVENAQRFAKERFVKEMKDIIYNLYNDYTRYNLS